jgi:restriction system protein
MIQEIPKFHETFNPILEILSNQEIIHTREMQKRVIEKYYSHLPKELLEEKTKSGEILINNRIAWRKRFLCERISEFDKFGLVVGVKFV